MLNFNAPVTELYDPHVVWGKIISKPDSRLFEALFEPLDAATDQIHSLVLSDENITWIRGHHDEGSEPVLAMRAAYALTRER